MGVSFDCPHCVATKIPPEDPKFFTIFVPFSNPLDGGTPFSGYRSLWQRTGENLESLTLAPSVDASKTHPGGWHGHVRDGRIE